MHGRRFRTQIYKLARLAEYVGLGCTILLAGVYRAGLSNDGVPGYLSFIVESVERDGWFYLLVAGLAASAGAIVARATRSPGFWAAMDSVIEEVREHSFDREMLDNDDFHCHRATLFRYNPTYWRLLVTPSRWRGRLNPWGGTRGPTSGWLVPVARSGHTTQFSRTVFLAPDDAKNAEGAAGKIWARKGELGAINLCEVRPDSPSEEISTYAREANVSVELVHARLRKGLAIPRCLAGFPVFKSRNRLWGVIVLDSERVDAILPPQARFQVVKIAQKLIQSSLSGV